MLVVVWVLRVVGVGWSGSIDHNGSMMFCSLTNKQISS